MIVVRVVVACLVLMALSVAADGGLFLALDGDVGELRALGRPADAVLLRPLRRGTTAARSPDWPSARSPARCRGRRRRSLRPAHLFVPGLVGPGTPGTPGCGIDRAPSRSSKVLGN
ncbi:hypothetical protein [Actinomadura sp. NTSP31]|uniref:hypothetical protein n=1 Tax=Actinomadura sp. NTSP31 TaxID=1735447 RepID=UPI0035BEC115